MIKVHLSLIDIALIVAYFAAVVFIGFRAARKRKSGAEDFLLAGRTLTLPVFVATLVSTWYWRYSRRRRIFLQVWYF